MMSVGDTPFMNPTIIHTIGDEMPTPRIITPLRQSSVNCGSSMMTFSQQTNAKRGSAGGDSLRLVSRRLAGVGRMPKWMNG